MGANTDVSGVAEYGLKPPPDGGTRAWVVAVASFLCNGVIFGLMNTYGVLYVEIEEEFKNAGVSEYFSKASLVGALAIGTTFFLSPVAGILTDKIGLRRTTFIGGTLAFCGLMVSSFTTESVLAMSFCYGILFGIGASLAYTPSLVILGHYFKKYMGAVNGFVTAGSSVFTIIMPYFISYLLDNMGLKNTLRVLACLMILLILSAAVFKPLQPPTTNLGRKKSILRTIINVEIWKEKRYLAWVFIIPISLLGYFVIYVHIVKFVTSRFPDSDGKVLVTCIGITSGIGRLLFGTIADLPRINRIFLQQVAFVSMGILTMLITYVPSFELLICIVLAIGLFDGCFISLFGPIAYDLVGPRGAGQAIGFLLGLCAVPLTMGPPIAGWLYGITESYNLAFILAGVPPILGGLLLTIVHLIKPSGKIPEGTGLVNGTSAVHENGKELKDLNLKNYDDDKEAVEREALVSKQPIHIVPSNRGA